MAVPVSQTCSLNTLAGGIQGAKTSTNFTSYGVSAVTVMFWYQGTVNNGNVIPVSLNDNFQETFQFQMVAGNLNFAVRDNGAASAFSGGVLPSATIFNGSWHHFAGTYDGTNVKMYLDGVQTGSAPGPVGGIIRTLNPAPLGIGARPPGNQGWQGNWAQARVFNIGLSPAQIATEIASATAVNGSNTFDVKLDNSFASTGGYTVQSLNGAGFLCPVNPNNALFAFGGI